MFQAYDNRIRNYMIRDLLDESINGQVPLKVQSKNKAEDHKTPDIKPLFYAECAEDGQSFFVTVSMIKHLENLRSMQKLSHLCLRLTLSNSSCKFSSDWSRMKCNSVISSVCIINLELK